LIDRWALQLLSLSVHRQAFYLKVAQLATLKRSQSFPGYSAHYSSPVNSMTR
jgi:hypothetical protein